MRRSIGLILALAAVLAWAAAGVAQVTQPISPPTARGVPPQTVRITRTELAALRDVQVQGQKQVAELAARLATTPPGPQRLALQQSIERAKLAARLSYLSALGSWAQAHGNATLAEQARDVAQRMTQLAQPPLPGTDMPREKLRAPKEVRP